MTYVEEWMEKAINFVASHKKVTKQGWIRSVLAEELKKEIANIASDPNNNDEPPPNTRANLQDAIAEAVARHK